MAMTLDGSNGVTFNDASLQGAAASPYVLKNRIINGDMRIDQRNAGASITPTDIGGGNYTLDRWLGYGSVASKFSVQQNAGSVTPPTGFTNYLGCTSLSAYTVGSSEFFQVSQAIEGYNMADFAWGTANAKTVTLSFQVYSSLTGTFGGAIQNSAQNRSYPFSYTISSANTWTTISITIAGDTSGTWLTTNGVGAYIRFAIGAGTTVSGTAGSWSGTSYKSATGATSVVGTNGATFYITGVQLEQNTSATPFERRLYNQELANCQRYYYKNNYSATAIIATVQSYNTSGSAFGQLFTHPVPMRAAPSTTNSGNTTFQLTNTASARTATTSISINPTLQGLSLGDSGSGSTTIAGGASVMYSNSAGTSFIDASAEL
jgi:hypothetical protein